MDSAKILEDEQLAGVAAGGAADVSVAGVVIVEAGVVKEHVEVAEVTDDAVATSRRWPQYLAASAGKPSATTVGRGPSPPQPAPFIMTATM